MQAGAVSLADTKQLGRDLLLSRSNVNNVATLLSILDSPYGKEAASISSVSTLVTFSAPAECRLEALRSLQAFFCPLLRSGKLIGAARKKAKFDIEAVGRDKDGESASDRAEAIYRLWVWNKYREFTRSLLGIISQLGSTHVLQVAAVHTLMDLVREEKSVVFNNSLYLKICAQMVGSKGQSNEILQILISKYFKYRDVRCFTYGNLEKLAVKRLGEKQRDQEMISSDEDSKEELVRVSFNTFVRNVHDVLLHLPPPFDQDHKGENASIEYWSNSGEQNLEKNTAEGKKEKENRKDLDESAPYDIPGKKQTAKKEKSLMTKAWLSFLQLSLPLDVYKKVLARLHRHVIPYLTNPLLLSDFLTQSYNTGGLISVMALSSLFILITKYGLEYPDFYNKLYALLEPSLFVAKYRSRFFELLDTCLNSPHLPGYLGAAFTKRLGRLVLSAPPSGAIVVIALIHNLLRRHPSINVLVHQPYRNCMTTGTVESDSVAEAETGSKLEEQREIQERILKGHLGTDPFIATEPDISKCNALKSSLWEIESLRRHYCPAVSRFVESLETDLTVRAKTSEVSIRDFSSASYATIFEEEVGRRLKAVPLSFYSTVPGTLFPESNSDGSFDGWRFKESTLTQPESLNNGNGHAAESGVKGDKVSSRIDEAEEDFIAEASSDEGTSDGSGGSRSRSEQSEAEDWPHPRLKRLRST